MYYLGNISASILYEKKQRNPAMYFFVFGDEEKSWIICWNVL